MTEELHRTADSIRAPVRLLSGMNLETARLAVRRDIERHPEAWGNSLKGAEEWATAVIADELSRAVGEISRGILSQIASIGEGLDEAEKLLDEAATGGPERPWFFEAIELAREWPWQPGEGGGLCRASEAVLAAARRIAPGWTELDECRSRLVKQNGFDAWEEVDGVPALVLRILCGAAAAAWCRRTERAKSSRPALARVVCVDAVIPMTTGQLDLLDPDRLVIGRREVGRVNVGRLPATMRADTARTMVHRGLSLFGTLAGQRMIDTLVRRGWAIIEGIEPGLMDSLRPRVTFRGGWKAVADAVMNGSLGRFDELKALAMAGACVQFDFGGIVTGSGLWSFSEVAPARGRKAEVAFTLNDPLIPGFVHGLGDGRGRTARESRRMVPVLSFDPPTSIGRRNEAGAVWNLSRLFLLEMVDRSPELVTEGGVLVTLEGWRKLAEAAGVPLSVIPRVLDVWQAGESERAPALLTQVRGDRWTLAEPHELELLFIEESGRRRLVGTENAKKAKEGKRADAVGKRRPRRRKGDG